MPSTAHDQGFRLLERSFQEPGFPGLACPTCSSDLLVSNYQKSFLLICPCGLQISLDELKQACSPELLDGLRVMLRVWERRLDSLQAQTYGARFNGFAGFATVMECQVQNLQDRVEQLRRFST